ncbi:MAG: hypothetical protein HY782_05795 [Chloroflexi bacterium]|nr:hypothetical protein [Chloroflexota bacterium]
MARETFEDQLKRLQAELLAMGDQVDEQLERAVRALVQHDQALAEQRAFVTRDAKRAKQLAAEDEEINRLYDQIYRELLTFMMEDPRTISRANYLLWIAHALERVGDRTTNIAERTVFLLTSEIEELSADTGRNE